MLATDDRPVWSKLTFAMAAANFTAGARHGIDAQFYWPGIGEIGWDDLVLRHLLPLAHEGLDDWGVSASCRDRYLGIIEDRCKTRQNGSSWQVATVVALENRGLSRHAALHEMLRRYLTGMHANQPVHTWEVPE
jgi:hypothetical protein